MDSKEEIQQKAKKIIGRYHNNSTDIILFAILEALIDIRDLYKNDLQQKYVGGKWEYEP